MWGSLFRVAVWLTSALCAFTLVIFVKTKRLSTTSESTKVGRKRKRRGEQVSPEKAIEEKTSVSTTEKEDAPPMTIGEDEKGGDTQSEPQKNVSETVVDVYPEHILTYLFLAMGLVMCAFAIVYEQEGRTDYVSMPFFIGLMFLCFGLGGVAGRTACAFFPESEWEGMSNLACATTGMVFVGGMMVFERMM